MKKQTYTLELITPCFCAGANPAQAEIRAPSIRGQLRWWFRTLGGFKSLAPMPVGDQEAMIFGQAAGDEGSAGKLMVRVLPGRLKVSVNDGQELEHPNFSDPAFLTFPIQSREKAGKKTQYNGRGVITEGSFDLVIQWRGASHVWPEICALIEVFGQLGALGFRGRRAMGALGLSGSSLMDISTALSHFASASLITVKKLPASSSKNAISVLGDWLRSCRSHGQSGKNEKEKESPYFTFAENDHDIGYRMPGTLTKAAFRPALGLPIIQRTQNGTNNWEWDWNQRKNKPEGRFASPVLLRPHKDAHGRWHALVIFVDAHAWPVGKKVFLNGYPRDVSLDLYNAMKADKRLTPFP